MQKRVRRPYAPGKTNRSVDSVQYPSGSRKHTKEQPLYQRPSRIDEHKNFQYGSSHAPHLRNLQRDRERGTLSPSPSPYSHSSSLYTAPQQETVTILPGWHVPAHPARQPNSACFSSPSSSPSPSQQQRYLSRSDLSSPNHTSSAPALPSRRTLLEEHKRKREVPDPKPHRMNQHVRRRESEREREIEREQNRHTAQFASSSSSLHSQSTSSLPPISRFFNPDISNAYKQATQTRVANASRMRSDTVSTMLHPTSSSPYHQPADDRYNRSLTYQAEDHTKKQRHFHAKQQRVEKQEVWLRSMCREKEDAWEERERFVKSKAKAKERYLGAVRDKAYYKCRLRYGSDSTNDQPAL